MHHFIYPSQDTFITSNTIDGQDHLNYGLDEILLVGTETVSMMNTYPTTEIHYGTQSVSNWCVSSFTGEVVSGIFVATASLLSGIADFATGSATYYSNFSQSLSGSFRQFSGSVWNFTGQVTNFSGKITAQSIYGTAIESVSHNQLTSSIISNRALLKFDIDAISQSIASGDITNPTFTLKLKVARAENLPITYRLNAHPLTNTWVMGNGYLSDDGSDFGASWVYRDSNGSTAWNVPGGDYSHTVSGSQIFDYEVGDVSMDVTKAVNEILVGNIPNNGFILLSDDENELTSSGMVLRFFSNDSNTIYRPVLDVAWDDSSITTQTGTITGVTISTHASGIMGTVSGPSQMSGSLSGSFSGIGNIVVDMVGSASGIVLGSASLVTATSSIQIYGNIAGYVSSSVILEYESQACPPGTYSTSSVSQSYLVGTFIDGIFSGMSFSANWDGYNLSNGTIGGTWNSTLINNGGTIVSKGSMIWPNIIPARFAGPYFSGNMIGGISATDSSSYGIYTGTLTIDNTSTITPVIFPFSGSIYLIDTDYTSSVTIVSSSLEPVQFNRPFVTIIQNLQPTVRSGNIIRVNVFSREEFPLKNFSRSTQLNQFLTPKYLPASSSYAIKDNQTEEIVVDFDNYTRLSCDMHGNYFLLDTTGLPQERYFKILIKTEQSGSSYTFDGENIFKIVR